MTEEATVDVNLRMVNTTKLQSNCLAHGSKLLTISKVPTEDVI